jgi:hypothetical protein
VGTVQVRTVNDQLDAAWDAGHEAARPGWRVGQPSWHHERDQWQQYAHHAYERASVGKRSREWTAVAPTELDVVVEMARCLREIMAGRVPR